MGDLLEYLLKRQEQLALRVKEQADRVSQIILVRAGLSQSEAQKYDASFSLLKSNLDWDRGRLAEVSQILRDRPLGK